MTQTAIPGVVETALDKLLERLPAADVEAFLGAQFDLGLAWVHFAPGRGGLGLPKDLQRGVDERLRAAGAAPVAGAGR